MHVLTPAIFEILSGMLAERDARAFQLRWLCWPQREQYLAMIQTGQRFDVGVNTDCYRAARMALSGQDRERC